MDGNQFNNIQNNQENVANMNEKKGRGLFYFVVAFAIIIISIVGATYAYFTATATTKEENAVTAGSSSLTLGLETDSSGLKTALIPVSENIAKYAYAEQKTVTYERKLCKAYDYEEDGVTPKYETDEGGNIKYDVYGNPIKKCAVLKPDPNSTCVDDSGSDVCSYYTFSVINNNSSEQTISMYLGTYSNSFANLWFAVYTDVKTVTENELGEREETITRTRITDAKPVRTDLDTEKEVKFIVRTDKAEDEEFLGLVNPKLETLNSRVTYTIVMWIKEMKDDENPENDDQTDVDGNKQFSGYVRVTSGDGAGVTGTISQANGYDDTETPTSPPEEEPEDTSPVTSPTDPEEEDQTSPTE